MPKLTTKAFVTNGRSNGRTNINVAKHVVHPLNVGIWILAQAVSQQRMLKAVPSAVMSDVWH